MSHPARQPLPGRQPRQLVTSLPVTFEALPGGGYRVSSELARGWAGVARTPIELAQVVHRAFHEVTRASVARARGEGYDLDRMTMKVAGDPLAGRGMSRPRGSNEQTRRTVRHKVHAPQAWTRMEDGRWRSPGGRFYAETTAAVQRVIRKLGVDNPP